MHIIELGLGMVFFYDTDACLGSTRKSGHKKSRIQKVKAISHMHNSSTRKMDTLGPKIQDLVSLEEHFTVFNKSLWKRDVPCSQYLKR